MNEDYDDVFVCTEHLKFLPCRTCLHAGTDFSSSDPADIEKVSRYHKGTTMSDKPEPNGICRTGCPTQDHKTWGDCARGAGIAIDKTSLRVK